MFFEDTDLELTDGLKKELLLMLNETAMGRIEYCLKDPWHVFEKEMPIGSFSVWLDSDHEHLKATMTLSGIVDRTVTVNDDKDFLSALADEFERLAKVIRSA